MLTAAAGSTDAVAYLGLGRVFTANMTGNLVLLGVAIGQGQLAGSLRSVIAFAAFGIGVFACARLTTTAGAAAVWPRSVTLAIVVELLLMVVLAAAWATAGDHPAALAIDFLIAISAGAMGVQAAATRRLRVAVTTTFLTGTLTSLIAELAGVSPDWSRWKLWAGTLVCMVLGAAAGTAVLFVWRPAAPLVAVLLVAIVAAAASRPAGAHE